MSIEQNICEVKIFQLQSQLNAVWWVRVGIAEVKELLNEH